MRQQSIDLKNKEKEDEGFDLNEMIKKAANKHIKSSVKSLLPKNAPSCAKSYLSKKLKAAKTIDGIRRGIKALQEVRNIAAMKE